jgi:transcriptional regulator with XRE-family HTH domain
VRNEEKVRAFAERLRKFRKERKWSQEMLALEADISLKTVQRLERAEYTGTLDILFSLAGALNIDAGELIRDL